MIGHRHESVMSRHDDWSGRERVVTHDRAVRCHGSEVGTALVGRPNGRSEVVSDTLDATLVGRIGVADLKGQRRAGEVAAGESLDRLVALLARLESIRTSLLCTHVKIERMTTHRQKPTPRLGPRIAGGFD